MPTIYLIGTAQGPRLVRAESQAKARQHVVAGFLGESRKATTDDLARINSEAGGLVIEDVDAGAGAGAETKGA